MNLFILILKKTELMSSKCVFLSFLNKILENSRLEVAGPELYVSGVEVGGEGWSWFRRGINRTGPRAHALKESSGKRLCLQLIGWGGSSLLSEPHQPWPCFGEGGKWPAAPPLQMVPRGRAVPCQEEVAGPCGAAAVRNPEEPGPRVHGVC